MFFYLIQFISIAEIEWSGTIEMQIKEFADFARDLKGGKRLSEPVFIGGFFWHIVAIMYFFIYL